MGYIMPDTFARFCYQLKVEMPKVFIETGAAKGGIPHHILDRNNSKLDDRFDTYHTIELDTHICAIADWRFKLFEEYGSDITQDQVHTNDIDSGFQWPGYGTYFDGRLNLYEGDSAEKMKEILADINEPCCFWLDAHAGTGEYARGEDDVPLFRELEVIKNHHIKTHVIAIDDIHLFGLQQIDKEGRLVCDYTNITYAKVHDKIKEINNNYDIGAYAPYHMQMLMACVIGE